MPVEQAKDTNKLTVTNTSEPRSEPRPNCENRAKFRENRRESFVKKKKWLVISYADASSQIISKEFEKYDLLFK